MRHSIPRSALLVLLCSFLAVLITVGAAGVIGTSSIRAPAVILQNNSGSLTQINLSVTSGNGTVTVGGPASVAPETVASAQTGAMYGTASLGLDYTNYDFNYTIDDYSDVSGPSAGAATALLAISALTHKPLPNYFTITGTINSDGSIGQVGGVYDKASAAEGMRFFLVPAVSNSSLQAAIYVLAQSNFKLPLIPVSNISQAEGYVFHNGSIVGKNATFNSYVNYQVNDLPDANMTCSNNCNASAFSTLANYTFNLTYNEVKTVESYPGLSGVGAQFANMLNQSVALGGKGYVYVGADQAFLDYINAYMFANGYQQNYSGAQYVYAGLGLLDGVKSRCSLVAPQLTDSNYEYVISGDLRQMWGNYTVSQDLAAYNTTGMDTDEIDAAVYSAGEANGWCSAANFMYSEASAMGGTPVNASQLYNLATMRLNSARAYGDDVYINTTAEAYNAKNYPAAIIDADYAIVFANSALQGSSMGTAELLNTSRAVAENSTYGIWATEFAKEANFYADEAGLAQNATGSRGYALQAYQMALLSSAISNDTMVIYNNLTPSIQASIPTSTALEQFESAIAGSLASISTMLILLLLIVIVLLILCVMMVVYILMFVEKARHNKAPQHAKGRNRRKR